MERLCSQRPTPRLSVLDISFVSDEDVESMNNALFPCVSETLEHLSMSIKLFLNRKLNKGEYDKFQFSRDDEGHFISSFSFVQSSTLLLSANFKV